MTRRMSQRARAQEFFREMAEDEAARGSTKTETPTLTLPLSGGGTESMEGGEPDLTARVRALYENSAVPVREIAAVAGVSERTLYKYAQKGGWKARYAWADRGGAARRGWPAADAAAPTQFAPANVMPVLGAGGRFIRREDSGQPFARGLKATDPHGATRATAACERAAAISGQAQAEAERVQWDEACVAWLTTLNKVLGTLAEYRTERAKRQPRPGAPATDAHEQVLLRAVGAATDNLTWCREQRNRLTG
jgi:hypothetical protein